ncbi:uncharacterized protein ATC70_005508 [Mucor velutinosus]|uniref:Uncharacterized protein n=1 Tax=Mucor velutinosus TaxID=708070 RepID=A0AAN7DEX3_9FUNG|nr:hypothetical protein ATC70_005508 [Mucor velutinosus]
MHQIQWTRKDQISSSSSSNASTKEKLKNEYHQQRPDKGQRSYLSLITTTDRPDITQSSDINQRTSMHQRQYTRKYHIISSSSNSSSNASSNDSSLEKPNNERHQRPAKD